MVIQKELMLSQLKNMPLRNRQMYDMVMSIGKGYKASANNMDIAEVINSAQKRQEMMAVIDEVTTNVAFSFGLSDPQKLNKKLEEIRQELFANSKDGKVTKGDLKKKIEKILKSRLKDAFEKAGLDPELIEEIEEREQEREEDRIQDQEQNQDLFILKADSERVHEREIEERNAMDRQKQIQEKALRVLEAMEKARDAIEKGKPIPEMDLSYLRELTPDEFSQQMNAFKKFGLQPIAIMKDGELTRENPERQITKETITKEDFEQGDIAFAIQFDKLVDPNWRENVAEKYKAIYERSGFDIKYRSETTKADDLIYSTKGNEATEKTGQVKEDDDKEYR